jgi:hypothetical protein
MPSPLETPALSVKRDTSVAGAVDHREWRARLKKRYSRKLPAVSQLIHQGGTAG